MSVAYPSRHGARRLLVRSADLVAILFAALLLLAGVAGAVSPYLALALCVGAVAGVATVSLVRLALEIHSAQRSFGPCRGAGFLGMGVLATGLTAVALPLTPAGSRPVVTLGGLCAALTMYLLGVLLLPGAATSVAVRLRRGFDGLTLGISLTFAGWLLLPPGGAMPPAALGAVLLAAGGLSTIAITSLRAYGHRRAAALCGFGAGAAVVGLASLVVLFASGAPPRGVLIAALPLVAGPVLSAAGARRADPVAQPPPVGGPEAQLSAYPLLTVPAVVAALGALYRLVRVGAFDRTSILLGLAVIPALVIREVLAAVDVRRFARQLAAQEAHFRSLVSGAHDLTLVVGDDLLIRWQSPAAARLFGLSDAEVLGRALPELMHPDESAAVTRVLTDVLARSPGTSGRPPLVTAQLRDGHGAWRDTEFTVSDQRGVPEVAALVVHVRDVSERRRLEHTLHQLAFTDQLTGLANRRELMRTIVTQRAVPGHTGALLVVDLHGMTAVNDVRGREVGDAVLIEVGRRLHLAARADDVVARLAGDEFAVLTVDGPVLAYAMAVRLLTALTEPYRLPGATVQLQVSVGLAELSGGDAVDDVLRRADLARRRARQLGRNRVEWYDAYLEEQLVRRLDLERELPGAVTRGELDLVYQPVVGLQDRQPVGTEALLRWRSPGLGTVLPAELLPVAEDLGILEEVGEWVLRTACHQLAEWSRDGRRLWMAVNVSPGELAAPDFVSRVAVTLAAEQLSPDRLVVEIAEPRVGQAGPAVVSQLAALRTLGVRTALDDFGAGQASLAHLRRLPMDFLKVDPDLVADAAGGRVQGKSLLDVVVSLGRRLGLEIIAEGLESATQVEQAWAAGCQFGQGFALSRPATAERVEAYLEEFPTPSR